MTDKVEVVQDPNTPVELLIKLARDEDKSVRIAVPGTLLNQVIL